MRPARSGVSVEARLSSPAAAVSHPAIAGSHSAAGRGRTAAGRYSGAGVSVQSAEDMDAARGMEEPFQARQTGSKNPGLGPRLPWQARPNGT